MQDEDIFLLKKEAEVGETDIGLAHQIMLYRMERGHCTALHMKRFRKLSQEPGFTGSIKPGISVEGFVPGDEGEATSEQAIAVDVDEVAEHGDGMSGGMGDGVEGQWNISEAADRADGVAPAAVDEDEDDDEEEDEGQADEDLSALMFNVFRVSID